MAGNYGKKGKEKRIMKKSEIYSEIYRELERLRDSNIRKKEERINQIYTSIPRIAQIDKELYANSIAAARAALTGSDSKAELEALKKTVISLNNEKYKLLEQNGFDKSYLDDIFSCEKCKDKGFYKAKDGINEIMCDCFKKRLVEKQYNMSSISRIIKLENFDTFNFNLFSREIDEKHNKSPYENMKYIVTQVKKSMEIMDKAPLNLYFYGSAGMGKTFLCNCIAKELMDKKISVLYTSAFNLFENLLKERFNKDEDNVPKEFLETYLSVDLLIIDDLGTENINSITITEFFNILNTRISDNKSTVISSNLSPLNLMDIYSERVSSRIVGEFRIFEFFGYDVRMM